mgnify:CR=1 FL=1
MKPEQVAILSKVLATGVPVMVGKYVAGKIRSGKRVDEKSGRTEAYGGFQHAVLCGREVVNVKQYADRDPEFLQKLLKADGNDSETDKLLPVKPGCDVVVAIKKFAFEKGAPVVTGELYAL